MTSLDSAVRQALVVYPIPRNMHPQFNVARRRARAKKILEQVHSKSGSSTFTDAARADRNRYVAVAVSERGTVMSACSVKATSPAIAEQVSIALGLLDSSRVQIYSDSRSAVRAFASGRVSPPVARILRGRTITPHEIIWFPAHMGSTISGITNSNELAHARARGLAFRAGLHGPGTLDRSAPPGADPLDGGAADRGSRDVLATFNEVTSHYRLSRRVFPPPHSHLTRGQEVTLRLLQTGVYPCPANVSIYMDISPDCPDCGCVCTFEHMMWDCPHIPKELKAQIIPRQGFYSAIKSTDRHRQLRAIQGAHDAAGRYSLPVPTWERPAGASG